VHSVCENLRQVITRAHISASCFDVRHNSLRLSFKLRPRQVTREKSAKEKELRKFREDRDRIAAALETQIKNERSCNKMLKVSTGLTGVRATAGDRSVFFKLFATTIPSHGSLRFRGTAVEKTGV